MLILVSFYRCLYWLHPAPYADGDLEVAALQQRPHQLEYG